MTPETIEALRESVEKDLLAARVLDTAALRIVRGWCRFNMARTADGEDCEPQSPSACQWCASGALDAAHFQLGLTRRDDPYRYLVWDRKRQPHGQSAAGRARYEMHLHLAGGDYAKVRAGNHKSITTWNDEEGRTKANILQAFGEAAGNIRLRIEVVQKGIREATG